MSRQYLKSILLGQEDNVSQYRTAFLSPPRATKSRNETHKFAGPCWDGKKKLPVIKRSANGARRLFSRFRRLAGSPPLETTLMATCNTPLDVGDGDGGGDDASVRIPATGWGGCRGAPASGMDVPRNASSWVILKISPLSYYHEIRIVDGSSLILNSFSPCLSD